LVFTRLDKGFAGVGMELWGRRGGSQTLRKGQEVSNEFYRGCLKIVRNDPYKSIIGIDSRHF